MNPLSNFPAHLITGDSSYSEKQVITWLQEAMKHNHIDEECVVCKAIAEKNFYGLSWLAPENRYTLDLIEVILHTITFQLLENQHHFFVITRAELLTQACANTLLKIVEEPPAGYHFIFIAPHKNLVLPTIVSRCVETHCTSLEYSPSSHPLVLQACAFDNQWTTIYKEIGQYTLNEHETVSLFEAVISTFTHMYKKKLGNDNEIPFSTAALEKLLHLCKSIIKKPLQPGSSKIVWKDFFITKATTLLEKA